MQPLNYKLPNIYFEAKKGKKSLFTKSLYPNTPVYGEKLVKIKGQEYRSWDHTRSKLAAAILKQISQIGLKENDVVLYLGASTGTTPSHISDIVGKEGFVFAVEFGPKVSRNLVFMCEKRKNIAPILADANKPEIYSHLATQTDIVYMDIAQKNQTEIFLKNVDMYLKSGGFGLLFVKARSIDVSKKPKTVYTQVRAELEKTVTIVDYKELDPFEKDHCVFVVKKR